MRSLELRIPHWFVEVPGLAAAYLIAAKVGLLFAIPPGNATAVWPASGIALAALVLWGNRAWPGIWIGATVASATTGASLVAAAAIGAGNTLAAWVGATLFRRLMGVDKAFLKVRDALAFAVLAAATCTISSSVGTAMIFQSGRISIAEIGVNWWTWWLGDVAGQMMLLPLVLALRDRRWRVSTLPQCGELTIAITLLAGVSYCLFGDFLPERLAEKLIYVTLLFLIWVALRFDLVEVTLTTGLLSIAAIWGTCRGTGAFGSEGFHPSLLNVQFFTYVYSVTGLAMASVVAGRRFFEVELQQSRDLLRHEVEERERTERAIRKSEATFRAVFASAPVMMLLLDEDRTVLATNPAADRMLAFTDPAGRVRRFGNAVQCAHSAESPEGCGSSVSCRHCPVRKIVEQTYETGEPVHSREVRLTHKICDEIRESYYLMSTSLPDIPDEREVLVCIEDITARKLAEERIRTNLQVQETESGILAISLDVKTLDEFLERTLDLVISVPWMSLQSKGSIFLRNEKTGQLEMKAQRGLAPEVISSCSRLPIGQCLCGMAAQSCATVFAEGVDGRHANRHAGMTEHGHYCVPIAADSQLFGVLNLFVEAGHRKKPEEEFFLSSVAQIMATTIRRKQIEEALLRSEERFDLAVRGTDAGIWDWELHSNQVFFSPRWKGMLGYDEHEIGNEFSEWECRLHPDDRHRALLTIQKYFRGETPSYQLEHRLRHKDGSYRWILARGAAVYDSDGKPYRMVGSHIDITGLKEAQAALRARDAELLAAQRIQKHLLPRQSPVIMGFDIAGASWPAELAAGDHFDYLRLPDGSIGIVVSDVSGHGFSSSLLMASTQAHLRSFATDHDQPDEIIEHVNRILCEEVEFGRFVTLLLVRLDAASGQMTFVNAGHPPGYLVDRSGLEKAALQSTSIPLGIERDTTFRVNGPLQIEVGECLVLYTDGLFEAQNGAGDSFEQERVIEVVRENREASSREIISRLHEAVCAFAGTERLEDDVTIVVIKRLQSSVGQSPGGESIIFDDRV
jgi:PAS domain S-box-containing protein